LLKQEQENIFAKTGAGVKQSWSSIFLLKQEQESNFLEKESKNSDSDHLCFQAMFTEKTDGKTILQIFFSSYSLKIEHTSIKLLTTNC